VGVINIVGIDFQTACKSLRTTKDAILEVVLQFWIYFDGVGQQKCRR
jgi:hypothetical protein